MKTENLIILGLAGLAVYFIVKNQPTSAAGMPKDFVSEALRKQSNLKYGDPGYSYSDY